MPALLTSAALLISLGSIVYLTLALYRVMRFDAGPALSGSTPPVTVLKPICGAEPYLYECLRSFCRQDYPTFQIVFGVRDSHDPGAAVVKRLIEEFPELDLALVVDGSTKATNPKVGNLIAMMSAARHQMIVVSDSDVWVEPNCLRKVMAELDDPAAGAVTCLYKAKPMDGIPSRLGALFINDWFIPSCLVDVGMRDVKFCFGPVTAVRRVALDAIGGFQSLADYLADDYMLGQLVAQAGYKVRLSRHLVSTIVAEPDLATLLQHELRWSRTVRTVRPIEHALSLTMHAFPLPVALLVADPSLIAAGAAAVMLLLRLATHECVRRKFDVKDSSSLRLLLCREFLCFFVWMTSLLGRDIRWRGRHYVVRVTGELLPKKA